MIFSDDYANVSFVIPGKKSSLIKKNDKLTEFSFAIPLNGS